MRGLRAGEKPTENKTVAENTPTRNSTPTATNEPTHQTTRELLAASNDAKKSGNYPLALKYLDPPIKNDARSTKLWFARIAV